MPPVKKTKEAKQIDALTKKYQCEKDPNSKVVPRVNPRVLSDVEARSVKIRQKNPWNIHLSEFYKKEKAKNPSYTYAEAMKDAKSSYNPVVKKPTQKRTVKDPKPVRKSRKAQDPEVIRKKLLAILEKLGFSGNYTAWSNQDLKQRIDALKPEEEKKEPSSKRTKEQALKLLLKAAQAEHMAVQWLGAHYIGMPDAKTISDMHSSDSITEITELTKMLNKEAKIGNENIQKLTPTEIKKLDEYNYDTAPNFVMKNGIRKWRFSNLAQVQSHLNKRADALEKSSGEAISRFRGDNESIVWFTSLIGDKYDIVSLDDGFTPSHEDIKMVVEDCIEVSVCVYLHVVG